MDPVDQKRECMLTRACMLNRSSMVCSIVVGVFRQQKMGGPIQADEPHAEGCCEEIC